MQRTKRERNFKTKIVKVSKYSKKGLLVLLFTLDLDLGRTKSVDTDFSVFLLIHDL